MDLGSIARVLWRFRFLVTAGVGVALALALLSHARPTFSDDGVKMKYRSQETWQSTAELFVTQPGFAWGSTLSNSQENLDAEAQRAAEGRLVTLATIYSRLALSDEVRALMYRRRLIRGVIDAAPVTASRNSDLLLPIVGISAFAPTRTASRQLANNASLALRDYVAFLQNRNEIPLDQRVELQVLRRGGHSVLIAPRSRTLPIVVFLSITCAVFFLAFALENMMPRVRPASERDDHQSAVLVPEVRQRTAS